MKEIFKFELKSKSLVYLVSYSVSALLIPVFGLLSDWFGRRLNILGGILLCLVSVNPCFLVLESMVGSDRNYSETWLMLILIYMVVVSSVSYAAVGTVLVELFPTELRYIGVSLPYQLAHGLAGLLPLISMIITNLTRDNLSFLWLPLALSSVTLLTLMLFLPETRDNDLHGEIKSQIKEFKMPHDKVLSNVDNAKITISWKLSN